MEKFNVVLISRTESKLKQTISDLKSEYVNLDFKYISADFTNATDADFFSKIFKELEAMNIDISVCVNNVGALTGGFHNSDFTSLKNTLVVNTTSTVVMSNYFTKKF